MGRIRDRLHILQPQTLFMDGVPLAAYAFYAGRGGRVVVCVPGCCCLVDAGEMIFLSFINLG